MTDIPRSVAVGAHRFTIAYDRSASHRAANGETYPELHEIRVAPDLPPTRERETLLHELLHVAWNQTPLRVSDHPAHDSEEQIVSALAPVLLEALRRNPDLAGYLVDPDPATGRLPTDEEARP